MQPLINHVAGWTEVVQLVFFLSVTVVLAVVALLMVRSVLYHLVAIFWGHPTGKSDQALVPSCHNTNRPGNHNDCLLRGGCRTLGECERILRAIDGDGDAEEGAG